MERKSFVDDLYSEINILLKYSRNERFRFLCYETNVLFSPKIYLNTYSFAYSSTVKRKLQILCIEIM